MKLRLRVLLALSLGAALVLGSTAGVASAAPPTTSLPSVPIAGTVPEVSSFTDGTFQITSFTVQNGQLAAVGTLTGTLTNLATGVTQTVNQTITLPAQVTGSCQILHLTLGPLDLNLLGLQVHLNQVVLDITAQQGPGNLLGNLLCAVAHLLDSNASGTALNQLVGLLNQILGSL